VSGGKWARRLLDCRAVSVADAGATAACSLPRAEAEKESCSLGTDGSEEARDGVGFELTPKLGRVESTPLRRGLGAGESSWSEFSEAPSSSSSTTLSVPCAATRCLAEVATECVGVCVVGSTCNSSDSSAVSVDATDRHAKVSARFQQERCRLKVSSKRP